MKKKNDRHIKFSLSFRRYHLDKCLFQTVFHGKVLDIGGKKDNKRGSFSPPLNDVESWHYVNIDAETNPDFLCSAESVPVPDNSYDCVLMCETLEHFEKPELVLQEGHRLLKQNGQLIISIPFLYPIHADPDDYQRWTPSKIKKTLIEVGFDSISIMPMGSVFAVIYDLLRYSAISASKNRKRFFNKLFRKRVLPVLKFLLIRLDTIYEYKNKYITTGYFVMAQKNH